MFYTELPGVRELRCHRETRQTSNTPPYLHSVCFGLKKESKYPKPHKNGLIRSHQKLTLLKSEFFTRSGPHCVPTVNHTVVTHTTYVPGVSYGTHSHISLSSDATVSYLIKYSFGTYTFHDDHKLPAYSMHSTVAPGLK